MSKAVYYDVGTGKVIAYDPSANTPDAVAAGALINPDLSAVQGVSIDRWRVVGGSVVDDPVLPDLVDYKNAKSLQLEYEVSVFLGSRYDPNKQLSLLAIHSNATGHGASRSNRKTHIQAALDWVELVLMEYGVKTATVMACSTHAEVDAVAFDWDAFLIANPDPGVTLASSLSIAD